jgi:K+-sensing histidine kinase KdpD
VATKTSPVTRLVAAVVVPVAVVTALVPLRGDVSPANLALLLVLVVLGGAVLGGRLVGVIVGAVTAVAFDFFLTVPYGSFTIERRDDVVTTVLLAIVGLVGGELVERARRSEAEALARRAEVEQLQRRAELAAGGEPPARLIARFSEELAAMLNLVDVSYQRGRAPAEMAVLTHWGASVPSGPGPTGPETVALPVRAHGRDLGHFRLVFPRPTVGMAVSPDARHAAVAVADQLGVALLRFDRP